MILNLMSVVFCELFLIGKIINCVCLLHVQGVPIVIHVL